MAADTPHMPVVEPSQAMKKEHRADPFKLMMWERSRHLIKYAGLYRCDVCRGEFASLKQGLLHFDLHDPWPLKVAEIKRLIQSKSKAEGESV